MRACNLISYKCRYYFLCRVLSNMFESNEDNYVTNFFTRKFFFLNGKVVTPLPFSTTWKAFVYSWFGVVKGTRPTAVLLGVILTPTLVKSQLLQNAARHTIPHSHKPCWCWGDGCLSRIEQSSKLALMLLGTMIAFVLAAFPMFPTSQRNS